MLSSYHHDYARVGLAPWRGMSHASNPPLPFQVEVVQGLLATYSRWQAELVKCPESYYLAVWVFELEFRESAVLVAIRQQQTRYEQFFGEPLEPQPPLPELLRRTSGAGQLRWQAYDNYYPSFDASDWEHPAALARHLQGRRYFTEARPDGDTLYWLHRGLVWVGTAPA
ncbi:hypothetical protein LJ737_07000 [Hymenobacter sp. 15J16-1T3B]|uniref:hypothetical protein n=1 Tax=Hymenobacter sp. 15J16-1T3B TaxID=2886941 RepID=UPI001D12D591|nr:hypothetical protein [Hymenobacter sp. 15J16-1T3B]MCC3156978.1 hypothetical protein [Hymenobacter sp. 15J16-1T3B]